MNLYIEVSRRVHWLLPYLLIAFALSGLLGCSEGGQRVYEATVLEEEPLPGAGYWDCKHITVFELLPGVRKELCGFAGKPGDKVWVRLSKQGKLFLAKPNEIPKEALLQARRIQPIRVRVQPSKEPGRYDVDVKQGGYACYLTGISLPLSYDCAP